jgi:diacylglycerol kinase (ATP)
MSEHTAVEISEITQHIYLGTNLCCKLCAAHGPELAAHAIDADISLEDSAIELPHGLFAFLSLPTPDHTAPTPAQIELGIDFIDRIITLDKKVFVHCRNGHGRSPTLVIAYLIRKRGLGFAAALEFVRSKRPEMHLHEAQTAFLQSFV